MSVVGVSLIFIQCDLPSHASKIPEKKLEVLNLGNQEVRPRKMRKNPIFTIAGSEEQVP
jgi:hypothetical protein